jgi:hypothetical protein
MTSLLSIPPSRAFTNINPIGPCSSSRWSSSVASVRDPGPRSQIDDSPPRVASAAPRPNADAPPSKSGQRVAASPSSLPDGRPGAGEPQAGAPGPAGSGGPPLCASVRTARADQVLADARTVGAEVPGLEVPGTGPRLLECRRAGCGHGVCGRGHDVGPSPVLLASALSAAKETETSALPGKQLAMASSNACLFGK